MSKQSHTQHGRSSINLILNDLHRRMAPRRPTWCGALLLQLGYNRRNRSWLGSCLAPCQHSTRLRKQRRLRHLHVKRLARGRVGV